MSLQFYVIFPWSAGFFPDERRASLWRVWGWLVVALAAWLPSAASAGLNVVPAVQSWSPASGTIDASMASIAVPEVYSNALWSTAQAFSQDLGAINCGSRAVVSAPLTGMVLTLDTGTNVIAEEGYVIEIGDVVTVRGSTVQGVFYGTRTLLQLLMPNPTNQVLARGVIVDWPQYRHRELMLDVARKPFPLPVLNDYLRILSWYKMNELHLHLSDVNHGGAYYTFRVECTNFPGLTSSDLFYSKAELRTFQDAAEAQGITVTPEIDMPGHSRVFTAYWPDLMLAGNSSDLDVLNTNTVPRMQQLLSEMIPVFDAPDFHIGTDEYGVNNATTGPAFRQFIDSMNTFVRSKGKNMRIWSGYETMQGTTEPDPSVIVDMWDSTDWATKLGYAHNLINSDQNYTYIVPGAHYYGVNNNSVYQSWNPSTSTGVTTSEPHLLGGALHVWEDQGPTGYTMTEIGLLTFPSIRAFAEKMWGTKGSPDYATFQTRAALTAPVPGVAVLDRIPAVTNTSGLVLDIAAEQTLTATNSIIPLPFSGQSRADLEYPWTLTMEVMKTAGTSKRGTIISSDLMELCSDYTLSTNTGIGAARTVGTPGADPASSVLAGDVSHVYGGKLPTNQWVSFAFVGDMGTTTLYSNGVKVVQFSDQSLCPLDRLGSKTGNSFVGKIRNLKVSSLSVAMPSSNIRVMPTNYICTAGQGASFSVLMNLAAPVVVQWQFNGVNIPEATNVTFALAAAQATNSGNYTVVVSNIAGIVTSPAATLRALAVTNAGLPFVTLATPTDGGIYPAGSSVSLSANVVANGHAIGKVQFFNGTTLLDEDANAPYSYTWTNVSAGNYTVVAQAIYDVTNSASSTAALIQTVALPATPQNFIITGVVSNQVSLAWTASPNASGYLITRNGLPLAGVSGINFTDTGLLVGSTYNYTVTATNVAGSSVPSSSLFATPPTQGAVMSWDASPGVSGAQDGSGIWGFSSPTWWYLTNNFSWGDNNFASFGVSTATNCTVTLANDISPAGITFNATAGTYTIAGTNRINFTTPAVITANGGATISATISASDSFTKAGSGTLKLTGNCSGIPNETIINGTVLFMTGFDQKWGMASSGTLTINPGGTAQLGDGSANAGVNNFNTATPITILGGVMNVVDRSDVGLITLMGGSIIGSSGTGNQGRLYIRYGITTLVTNITATIANGNLNLQANNSFNVAAGATPSGVDLRLDAAIAGAASYSLVKSGAGIMALSGANTYSGPTTVSAGTLLVNGSIGTNTVTVAAGATLAGTGVINGVTTIQNGGTFAPGAGGIGRLTVSNSLTLAGNSTARMEISRNGGVPTNDVALVSGALTQNGALVVTNIGTNALAAGDSFTLFKAGGYTGAFMNLTLPALTNGLVWNTGSLATNGTISIQVLPVITNLSMAANRSSFTLAGTGSANQTYVLLAATNLPSPTWTPVQTNQADTTGAVGFTDLRTTNYARRFYRIQAR